VSDCTFFRCNGQAGTPAIRAEVGKNYERDTIRQRHKLKKQGIEYKAVALRGRIYDLLSGVKIGNISGTNPPLLAFAEMVKKVHFWVIFLLTFV